MTIRELLLKNRSYRRFYEEHNISTETLRGLVELTRFCPSGGNRQSLKYIIENDRELCGKIFDSLAWAGYLKDWHGPSDGERPSAYIIILEDSSLGTANSIDVGIAAQSILLGAAESGLGGCMLGSIKRQELATSLNLPEGYKTLLVIALGKPVEKVVIDDAVSSDIRYWRDENAVHHVPKRKLNDILL